jgi:hypothetical protein
MRDREWSTVAADREHGQQQQRKRHLWARIHWKNKTKQNSQTSSTRRRQRTDQTSKQTISLQVRIGHGGRLIEVEVQLHLSSHRQVQKGERNGIHLQQAELRHRGVLLLKPLL